jgi:hypothetical protein
MECCSIIEAHESSLLASCRRCLILFSYEEENPTSVLFAQCTAGLTIGLVATENQFVTNLYRYIYMSQPRTTKALYEPGIGHMPGTLLHMYTSPSLRVV